MLGAFSHLEKAERPLVLLLILQYFLAGIANSLTLTVSYALFLGRFGSTALPFIYIANAIIITFLSSLYLRVSRRFAFTSGLIGVYSFLLLALLLLRISLWLTNSQVVIFTLPILFQIMLILGNVVFWTLAGRLFDVRQGKRLFGLVGTGYWLAAVSAGFITPVLVRLLGTVNLFWVAALSMGGAILVLRYLISLHGSKLNAQGAAPARASAGGYQGIMALLQNRYLLLIFGMTTCLWLAFYLIDNVFFDRARAQYPQQDDFASFFGVYIGLMGVLTLSGMFFLSSWVLNRYGVRVGLLGLPAALLVGTVMMSLSNLSPALAGLAFWSAAATRLLNVALLNALNNPSVNVLFQPLPPDQRSRTQVTVEGIIQPLAIGLAGGIILLLVRGLGLEVTALAYLAVVVIGLWLGIALGLGRAYGEQIRQALAGRRLRGATLELTERGSTEILHRALADTHVGAVSYALDVLAHTQPEQLPAFVPALLSHPNALVRKHVLRQIDQLGLVSTLPAVRTCLEHDTPDIQAVALQTLAQIGTADDLESLLPYLDHADHALQQNALIGLLRCGELEYFLIAAEKLVALVRSTQSAERILAAQVIGAVGRPDFYRSLLVLLQDPDLAVQSAALGAAGQVKSPKLWSAVVQGVYQRATRSASLTALTAGGNAVLPALVPHLATSGMVRLHLITLLGRLRSPEAGALLWQHLQVDDEWMVHQVLIALNQCGYRLAEADAVEPMLEAEICQGAWLLSAIHHLIDQPYLTQVLTAQVARHQRRVLLWLGLAYDPALIQQVQVALAIPTRQGYALEALDMVISRRLKNIVFPFLEEATPAQRLAHLAPFFPQPAMTTDQVLETIKNGVARWFNPWVKANAGHAAGDKELAMSLPLLERMILLKETSFFADVPEHILAEVAALVEEVEIPPRTNIIHKGDHDMTVYIIASGAVRVYDGEHELARMGSGEVFGEMAVLDAYPRSSSVAAVEHTRLLKLDHGVFSELLDNYPDVAKSVIRVLVRRLRETQATST